MEELQMIDRRNLLVTSVFAFSLLACPALAAETAPYTAAVFDAAQKANRPILVEIHASWCPTCKAQVPILSEIQKDKAYDNLLVLRVDFDTQKDVLKRFGAQLQSTLITFKNGKETGRSVGDTNAASIAALVAKAI
jgi:thiol-disulfide isomerase/thioredoxin